MHKFEPNPNPLSPLLLGAPKFLLCLAGMIYWTEPWTDLKPGYDYYSSICAVTPVQWLPTATWDQPLILPGLVKEYQEGLKIKKMMPVPVLLPAATNFYSCLIFHFSTCKYFLIQAKNTSATNRIFSLEVERSQIL